MKQFARKNVDFYIKIGMQLVGVAGAAAIIPALMPNAWFESASQWLGLEFAAQPINFYLARQLSLLYTFLGIGLLIMSGDVPRYLPLIKRAAPAMLVVGMLQIGINWHAGMPTWWTAFEGTRTMLGAVILMALINIRVPGNR